MSAFTREIDPGADYDVSTLYADSIRYEAQYPFNGLGEDDTPYNPDEPPPFMGVAGGIGMYGDEIMTDGLGIYDANLVGPPEWFDDPFGTDAFEVNDLGVQVPILDDGGIAGMDSAMMMGMESAMMMGFDSAMMMGVGAYDCADGDCQGLMGLGEKMPPVMTKAQMKEAAKIQASAKDCTKLVGASRKKCEEEAKETAKAIATASPPPGSSFMRRYKWWLIGGVAVVAVGGGLWWYFRKKRG